MGRRGTSYEKKLGAVEKYKRGEGSQESIAREYGVHKSSLQQWIANYEAMGPAGLAIGHTNSRYSVELKTAAIEAYLRGEGSQVEICKRYSIRNKVQLQDWIKLYNGHKDLRTTGGRGRDIYMTKGRLTTLDERIEIVSYCIAQGKDYGAVIEKYGVSYQQIYSWVRKYEVKGVEGLVDKRGKSKSLEEMNEMERLRAENRMLRAENYQKEMEIAVLKKAQEIEGRRG
ncbi:transposase [Desulfosporosinus orientis DSM 765]|uniref:Transposase n=1 Tax=Desulfosporosinus orientis (strain ATCC 19365 / DSM 765 / NCIMB 8382 / VKM B-1628 / Singapore I) TaxID=768706 RepID=G7W812_DESOD|nr:helix-turn-helix domain-containing protein [Desulfosporosinus orientis]AET66438.1 transposase [Desulfosporosinus orientis DSM 765]